MLSRGSKLYSVMHGVCPRCQQRKIFKNPPYKTLNFTQMNQKCSYCGQSFEPEPDFYQGAMYVSYGLSTGLFMVVGVIMLFILKLNMWLTFSTIGLLALLTLPFIFRVSRIIWLNLFVSYKPLHPEHILPK